MLKREQGFTLIELMIVIAIIGILAAIAIPNFISYRNKSYCSRGESDADGIKAAIGSYFSNPARTATPTVSQLKTKEKLTTTNPTFTVSGNANTLITITVTDASGKCPRGSLYTTYIGSSTKGKWNLD